MTKLELPSLRPRLLLWVLAGAIIAVIAFMALNVARDLQLLKSASSDNVQWTLSQAEVEFLEYELDLVAAEVDPEPDLDTLRQEFDIFYSRINTLSQAGIYAELRELPEFSRNLRIVRTYLDRTVDAIDASDAEMLALLPEMRIRANDVRRNVRQLSNSGLNYFAEEADRRRNSIRVMLIQMAALVTVLLLALVLLAVYQAHLNAQNIRRRREAIEASERMNVVTGTALDAVIVSDYYGRILDYNAAAEEIFGYPAETAIGQKLGDLIVPDHFLEEHEIGMERMHRTGEKRFVGKGRVKLEAKRANGDVFPVEFAVQSAETDKGEIFIAFLRDISHRMQAERELMAARDRALAGEKAKTDFLATMSHEIRTPLNGLLGNLSLLSDTEVTDKQLRYIKNMDTSGKLLMNHISDVLDITKYDAGKLRLRPVPMSISTLLQDIVDNQSGAASANQTTLNWGWVGTSTDWISADRDRIQHILMNVIGNAVKFTQGGHVTVEAELRGALDDAPELRIAVKDTGIGMSPELQEQIFDDFMTGDSSYDRDVEGTGLGLGIAQRFVKALGGQIEVESEPGKGSTFTISFPIHPIEPPEETEKRQLTPQTIPSCDILLVEDNEINLVLAREMLTKAGHNVRVARNGQIAVDMARDCRFDLILMDISMPVMDGRGATRAIRSGDGACADVPIVALTANAVAEEQEAFLSDGMNDVLTKPLTRDGLIRIVADHVVPSADAGQETAEPSTAVAATYLKELREALGAEALQPLLDRFHVEVEEALVFLSDHRQHTAAEIGARAHKIAGSAATLGAVDLRATLVDVERAAKAEDLPAMEKAIQALPKVWEVTRPLLRA